MGGLAVFVLIGIYFVVAGKIVRSTKSKRAKWLAVVILTLLPTADAVVGRLYLKHLCATEGGLRVNRVVNGVEGFVTDLSASDHWIKEHGFQFAEGYLSDGRVNRYSRQDGKIILEVKVMPKSVYSMRSKRGGERDLYSRNQYIVEIKSTNEILAINTQIGFKGGWVERFLGQFSGAGAGAVAWCENVPDYQAVVLNSLKP